VRRARGVVARARGIRMIVMDVDGVLTDGRMILSERGDELKAFHAHDGVGLALARRAGLKTAMITGETSPIAKARGTKLGVDAVVLGARRKGESLEALLAAHDLPAEAAAYVGDDLLDLPALERAGLAVAVADAAPEVRAAAHVVTRAAGGHGAIREVVELILRAQGCWRDVVDSYAREHGGRGTARRRRGGRG
jgi:3-deoxy-D-manno-octulosonate 8-phosphate phosphatase (KDO 8-P phosphatase)